MSNDHSAFVGKIPVNYEKYLGPLIFDVYAEDLASRISIPDKGVLLETAAGTGLATRKIRNQVSSSIKIVATDLNADMLQLAEGKFDASENIEFQTANAENLPFDDSFFDGVACQFSIMFFPDKLAALKEAARVLKPGGSFYFNIWDSFEHNELVKATHETLSSFFTEESPDFFTTPYGYFEIDKVKELLGTAGFSDIEIAVLPRRSSASQARDVALGYILGTPARLQIEKIAPDSLNDVVDRVEQAIIKKFGAGLLSAKMQAIAFTAHVSV